MPTQQSSVLATGAGSKRNLQYKEQKEHPAFPGATQLAHFLVASMVTSKLMVGSYVVDTLIHVGT